MKPHIETLAHVVREIEDHLNRDAAVETDAYRDVDGKPGVIGCCLTDSELDMACELNIAVNYLPADMIPIGISRRQLRAIQLLAQYRCLRPYLQDWRTDFQLVTREFAGISEP